MQSITEIISPIKLLSGPHAHTATTGQGCFMNVIAYLNGEPQITDKSPCVCFTVRGICIWLNDKLNDYDRHKLLPFIERAMGSATDDKVEISRRVNLLAKYAAKSAKYAAESAAKCAAKYAAKYAESAAEFAAKYAAESAECAAKYAESAAEFAAEYAAESAEFAAKYAAESAAEFAKYAAKFAAEFAAESAVFDIWLEFLDEALPKSNLIQSNQTVIDRAVKLMKLV
jgi:hypothetical protein